MTDNKIIKLLECKQKCLCDDCKVKNTLCCEVCIVTIQKQAIDIITRQKDEIERLNTALDMAMKFHSEAADERDSANTEIEKLQTDYSSMQSTLAKMSMGVEQAKAEAIKEFAEELKKRTTSYYPIYSLYVSNGLHQAIDNLVKEMVGDTE